MATSDTSPSEIPPINDVPSGTTFQRHESGSAVFASRMLDLAGATRQVAEAIIPPEQEAARQEVLRFCAEHDDALVRSCYEGHLTASAFVVDPANDRVALIHHRKLDRWLQPGGHADGEGNLALVAATEVSEEIGLDSLTFVLPAFDLDIHVIPERGDDPRHLHLDLRFLAIVNDEQTLRPNEETWGAEWVGADDPRLRGAADVAVAARRAIALGRAL